MNINKWRDFLAESSEKVLRELSDDELTHIADALNDMESEDLAFHKLFDGRMRVVIDFPTMDTTSELGKFVDFFRDNGYQVDWGTGILKGEQQLADGSVENLVRQLTDEPPVEPKSKKIQMKVGKFFMKIAELAAKQQALLLKVAEHGENKDDLYNAYKAKIDYRRITGNMINDALSEQEATNLQRLNDHLRMYLPSAPSIYEDQGAMAKKMGKYWQENAEFIKREIHNLKQDDYVIVITRHPIDVLRMSDHRNINSCHSPPSRSGGESYYKCAVAEAHGHGAVAYVVDKGELLEHVGDKFPAEVPNPTEYFDDLIQQGEIFDDDMRREAGTVTPVSRLRLRQVRYYEATQGQSPSRDDYKAAGRNPFDGIQLAVPEKRVYGEKIPGFRERVMAWATENQQENMNIVKRDSEPDNSERVLKLSKFIKFGGSHEDNQIGSLLADLFAEDGLPANTEGRVVQDTSTEDELDMNLVGSLLQQWQEQVENIADEWNHRYQAVEVSAEAEDDHGGGTYIMPRAAYQIKWDESEFTSLPGYSAAGYAVSELNDIGWGWAEDGAASIRRVGDEIIMVFNINLEMVPDSNGMGFAADPDDFEDLCVALNAIDDHYDGVKEYIERFFKREGHMQGGELESLARDIIYDDLDNYLWDLETDDRYDAEEVDSITASVRVDFGLFDPELPEHNPKIALAIAQDRDWRIEVRKIIHKPVQEELGVEYYVDTTYNAWLDASNDVIFELTLSVRGYSGDEQVALLRQIIETWQDEDVLRDEHIRPLMMHAFNSRMPSGMQQNLDENERIVKSWKRFLNG